MMKTYKHKKQQKNVGGSANVHNNFRESGTVCGAKCPVNYILWEKLNFLLGTSMVMRVMCDHVCWQAMTALLEPLLFPNWARGNPTIGNDPYLIDIN